MQTHGGVLALATEKAMLCKDTGKRLCSDSDNEFHISR